MRLISKDILKLRDKLKKDKTLLKVFFRLHSRKLSESFMIWKLATKVHVETYIKIAKKSIHLHKIVRFLQDRLKWRARNSIAIWRFQIDQGFPMYIREKQPVEHSLCQKMMKMTEIRKRKYCVPFVVNYQQLTITLSNFTDMLEKKLSSSKRSSFRRFKVLMNLEKTVIDRKQPLLIRNLSVNVPFFNHFYGGAKSKMEYSPHNVVRVINGRHEVYNHQPIRQVSADHYFYKFMDKMKLTSRTRVTDSQILMTGIWSRKDPFFRLRDLVLIKLLQRRYVKMNYVVLTKLKFHRLLSNTIVKRQTEVQEENRRFRLIWSRMLFNNLIVDKTVQISDRVMVYLEVNKRKAQLLKEKTTIRNPDLLKTKLKAIAGHDSQDFLKDIFKKKLNEVRKTFAKNFLVIILRTNTPKQTIKKDLELLLIDTIHYLTCGTMEEAELEMFMLNKTK